MPAGQPRRHRRFWTGFSGRHRGNTTRGAALRVRERASPPVTARLPATHGRMFAPLLPPRARLRGCDDGMSCARSTSRRGTRTVKKLCALLRKSAWCGAKTTRRTPARRHRVTSAVGCQARMPGCIRDQASTHVRRAWRCAKCLVLCDLRKRRFPSHGTRKRSGGRSRRLARAGSLRWPAFGRKKICAGLLTGRKTVIRFRPADESCGTE